MTKEMLLNNLNYDENTGVFTRKSGKIAGTKDRGYIKIGMNGRGYMAHRLAWLYHTGYYPKKHEHIDHLDHNRSNNVFSNLCLGSIQKNLKNRSIHKNNKSGHMGVYKKTNGKYVSQIWVDNKGVHLGTYETYEDAVKARKDAEKHYGYHENHGTNKKDRQCPCSMKLTKEVKRLGLLLIVIAYSS